MIDDDMKKIEEFLKTQSEENSAEPAPENDKKIQLPKLPLDEIERYADNFVKSFSGNNFSEKIRILGFSILEEYKGYSESQEKLVRDFSLVLILTKKIIELVTEAFKDPDLTSSQNITVHDLNTSIDWIKKSTQVFKTDVEALSNYLAQFVDYSNNMINLLPIDN